ncbi:signal peptidase I [Ruminococcus flavefaciens]|uniref:Signal peptidase I n=1 Tax=Ruminococcus flavefaciens TaxID=1265 RepID=A0A1M7K2D4_RUMFL|nr:signal peptidase I [Ruminococcus flavefaciens]SHM59439.1 signal peptidase, endoplasmic reticulum-type [Ruminococcus flavefaciens]
MKKALKITVNIFAWIVLIIALLITIIVFSSDKNNGVANLFGYIPMTVESDSMVPTFNKGDLIICKDIDDVNALKEGDVITFWTIIDGKRVKNTHRIVGVNDTDGARSFVTRGDNNPIDDTLPAYASDIIGKWTETKIAKLGNAMNFLRTKKGFFICILIPMAIFFLLELYKFIIALIEVKRPETPEIDEEEIKRRAIEEYLASKGETAEAAEAVKDKAEKTAETVSEKAEETVEAAAEKVEETAEKAAEAVEEAAENTEETAEKAEEAAEKAAEEAVGDSAE